MSINNHQHHHHEIAMHDTTMAAMMEAEMKHRFLISFILVIPLFALSHAHALSLALGISDAMRNWLLCALATPLVFGTGSLFITGAYYSLKSRSLDMSVLIATGVLTAYFASIAIMLAGGAETFFDASGMLVTFVVFGHWMEMKSRRGTSDALQALIKLIPTHATIIQNGNEVVINAHELKIGDIVLIKPGEKIPTDGTITRGQTTIDESLITGESMPVVKKIGDKVIGGSLNQMGSIEFTVTHSHSDTMLAQIIKLVENAQSSKAPGQRLADKAAAYLVVIAIGSGIVTFIAWYIFSAVPLLTALSFAISAIVVACPDALGLATPTAVAVATGIGARNNILIKNAATLEQTSKINVIMLDKTGTLTQGKLSIHDIITLPSISEHDLLYYAASAQQFSNHPFSKAILEKAALAGIKLSENVKEFKALEGLGTKAAVDNKLILIGTPQLLQESQIDISPIKHSIAKSASEGVSISIIALDGKVVGAFSALDEIKPSAKDTIIALHTMGIESIMITGDTPSAAHRVAHALGIARYFAQVLPADKRNYVKKLQDEGRFVAMVGDGINDAPALAQADIGIAIGAGTDVALESASIILIKSDPADIVKAIKLSRATVRTMKQNLFWASCYNLLAIPVAAGVFYTSFGWALRPEISALLMSISSIIVALNAVSLKFVSLSTKK